MTPDAATRSGPLIVVPCLNESQNIGRLLVQLQKARAALGGTIVVVDGGSTDGTQEIVGEMAGQNPAVHLLDNPKKFQSAGVNLAVKTFGDTATQLIRIDAHSSYPDDFCQILLTEARDTGAASIVVSMAAQGDAGFQQINAAAQNSTVGNGGSKHRNRTNGQYVDHGHHALMSIAAFRVVGGYDEGFSHNEDAELDYRLRRAGYRIWLTAKTRVTYFPRSNFAALARQYYNFGKGRARNLLKHRIIPGLRQLKVAFVLPALLMWLFAGFHWALAFPALFWLCFCLASGLQMALAARDAKLVGSGVVAMLMHVAWSLGFWRSILFSATARGSAI